MVVLFPFKESIPRRHQPFIMVHIGLGFLKDVFAQRHISTKAGPSVPDSILVRELIDECSNFFSV